MQCQSTIFFYFLQFLLCDFSFSCRTYSHLFFEILDAFIFDFTDFISPIIEFSFVQKFGQANDIVHELRVIFCKACLYFKYICGAYVSITIMIKEIETQFHLGLIISVNQFHIALENAFLIAYFRLLWNNEELAILITIFDDLSFSEVAVQIKDQVKNFIAHSLRIIFHKLLFYVLSREPVMTQRNSFNFLGNAHKLFECVESTIICLPDGFQRLLILIYTFLFRSTLESKL